MKQNVVIMCGKKIPGTCHCQYILRSKRNKLQKKCYIQMSVHIKIVKTHTTQQVIGEQTCQIIGLSTKKT